MSKFAPGRTWLRHVLHLSGIMGFALLAALLPATSRADEVVVDHQATTS